MYITISNADELYSAGQILDISSEPMLIYMILGDKVYIRHLNTFEWVGYKARQVMEKLGL